MTYMSSNLSWSTKHRHPRWRKSLRYARKH